MPSSPPIAPPTPPPLALAASVAPSPAAADLAAVAERFGEFVLARDDGGRGDGAGRDPLAAPAPGREPTVVVDRGVIVDVARFLRDERGYQLLRSVTAVDYLKVEPRFQVVYHFTRIPAGVMGGDAAARADDPARLLCVKVPVPGAEPVVATLTDLYPTANWHERETFDLFGIEFAGHPDLRRILMPADYEGFPLRKDHPLQYEEVAFSFNQDDIYRRKPFAKE